MLEVPLCGQAKLLLSFLDVTRATLGESTLDMHKLVDSYSESLGLTDLKLDYNERRGYHLKLPASRYGTPEC